MRVAPRDMSGGRFLGPIAVPPSGHRFDESWTAPVVAELHAKLADVPVDDVALDLEFASPDARDEVLSAEHLARVRGEEVEECLLNGREREIVAGHPHALFHEVHLERVQLDLRYERH